MEISWQDKHLLFHYTESQEVVASILKNGFMFFPNRRGLINRLLRTDDFKLREPQQFGMISFTELDRENAGYHRQRFGDFGIAVSWEWAQKHNIQRVIYVGEGPVLETLSWLFCLARQEVEDRCGDDLGARDMALENRNAAVIYSQTYARLLTLYEYMETERNSNQVEWRIVNPLPEYNDLTDFEKLKEKLLSFASNGVGTVRVTPDDIELITCPREKIRSLRAVLPTDFQSIPIIPYSKSRSFFSVMREFITYASAIIRRRKADRYQTPSGIQQSIWQEILPGVHKIPAIKSIRGVSLIPNVLLEDATCTIDLEDKDGSIINLEMPFQEAVALLDYFKEMANNPMLCRLIQLARRRKNR